MLVGHQDLASPSAQQPDCPISSREGKGTPPPPLEGDWEKEAPGLPFKREVLSLPQEACPPRSGPLLRPSPGFLHRWEQHRAPTPTPPAIHHAPGGASSRRCSCRHQLCLWSPPQLLQLLRQFHEPSGTLQPHEPRQQRPVSSGRWPHSPAQRPIATCPPVQPTRAGDTGWLSWGRSYWSL